ncbi:Di-copper centre-containing protein, partial [Neoconidiobolus thromboides FSU 785]
MNLLFIISLFLTSINTLATLQGPCLTIVKRKEIRQLSPSELSKFINATLQLKQKGVLDEYSKIHLDHTEVAHNVGGFLPWHRYFLKQLELQLIQIDPSITLPYWDWTLDSQAPERSILFQPNYFGGNGDKQKNECISTSPYATWSMQVPSTHCLKRKFDLGDKISSFYSPEAIEAILRTSTTYDQFRKNIELIPHAKVHDNIGGDMTEMFSPNDPLFYLHHAFVDLLWFEWQKRFPGLAETYD